MGHSIGENYVITGPGVGAGPLIVEPDSNTNEWYFNYSSYINNDLTKPDLLTRPGTVLPAGKYYIISSTSLYDGNDVEIFVAVDDVKTNITNHPNNDPVDENVQNYIQGEPAYEAIYNYINVSQIDRANYITETIAAGFDQAEVNELKILNISNNGDPVVIPQASITKIMAGINAAEKRNRRHKLIRLVQSFNRGKTYFKTTPSSLGLSTEITKTNVNVFRNGELITIGNHSDGDTAFYCPIENTEQTSIQPVGSDLFIITRSDVNSEAQYTLSLPNPLGTLNVTNYTPTSGTYNVGTNTGYFVDGETATINGVDMFFGGAGEGGGSGGIGGDPFIFPVHGKTYETPMKATSYRMLQGRKLIMNMSQRRMTKQEGEVIKQYYKQFNNEDAPKSLITKGVYINKTFLKVDGQIMEYDFDTGKGQMSSDYFTITQETKEQGDGAYLSSPIVKQIHVSFRHSIYGNMIATLNHYSNPQMKSGVTIKYNAQNPETKDLTGLLVREYKCKSMECHRLHRTKKLQGKFGNNKVLSYLNNKPKN
jgi:hypothetical protein